MGLVGGILENIAEAHTIHKVHHDKRSKTKEVTGSGTPRMDPWNWNGRPLVEKTQGHHLLNNLLVGIVVTDHPYTREANHPGSTVTEDYLHTGIKCAMVKGTIELTGELVGMENRHPRAETACTLGIVHLVNP
jgi:hypothetical protein